jgi:Protein of unknown function (DUF2281)
MEQEKIFDDISNLPPEAQRQVVDFIAFLRTRYKRSDEEKQTKRINLANESFIGIWKDREDMNNSSTWVRNVRKAEWGTTS